MKVALLASGPFAIPVLDVLHQGGADFELHRVVSRPDRPAGRGRKQRPNPVKARALELGVDCRTPESVNTPEFREEMDAIGTDVFIVADYGEILREEVLSLPSLGSFNLHASLLPAYRGAAPVVHAILGGEDETGVTLFRLERGLDSGPVLACSRTPIDPAETAGELEARLSELSAALLLEQLPVIAAGNAAGEAQDESLATLAPKLKKSDGLIDWDLPASSVCDLVRAMNPWPLAHGFLCPLQGKMKRVSILRSIPGGDEAGGPPPGTVHEVDAESFSVSCGRGALRVLGLQREGKPAMDAAAFMRGNPIEPGDQFRASVEVRR